MMLINMCLFDHESNTCSVTSQLTTTHPFSLVVRAETVTDLYFRFLQSIQRRTTHCCDKLIHPIHCKIEQKTELKNDQS